jgi:exportin-5
MDTRLVELWNVPDSAVHKEFVMLVLESLSDEVLTGDDTVVALREGVLSKACVEIFTPTSVLLEAFPNRQAGPDVRHGPEGWLSRVTQLLSMCLASDIQNNEEIKGCTVKCLGILQVLLPWAIPKAISTAQCVSILCQALACPSSDVQRV